MVFYVGTELYPRKTHSITITFRIPHPPLILCGLKLMISCSLNLLRVTLDNKLTFEKRKKTGLIRKCYKTLGINDAVLKSFYVFILPCFEYWSPVWCSASNLYLKLFNGAFNNIRFFLLDILINLENVEI